jgi:hypothetical protein
VSITVIAKRFAPDESSPTCADTNSIFRTHHLDRFLFVSACFIEISLIAPSFYQLERMLMPLRVNHFEPQRVGLLANILHWLLVAAVCCSVGCDNQKRDHTGKLAVL